MAESKYLLLLRLADDKQQAAAERMGHAQKQLDAAKARLDQLSMFREDYRQRLLKQSGISISMVQYRDFQRFLGRLDEAMDTQQGEVERCIQRFLLERQAWQDAYKQFKAFEKLLERERERAAKKEAKLQQKITDEFAARRFWDNSQ